MEAIDSNEAEEVAARCAAIEREVSVATLAASSLGGKIEILCICVRLQYVHIRCYVGTTVLCVAPITK